MARSSPPSPRSRDLRWEGCWNVRDLGGLPLEAGGETAFGRIVRADSLGMLSEAGWKTLRDYGIERIVDLRHEDPPYEAPVEVVRVPLVDPPAFAEVDELLAGVTDPIEWRRRNYLYFLEGYSGSFAKAVAAIAHAPDGAVAVHCAGGVDRTGLVAALILRLAGVGIEAVADDYEASGPNWAPFSEEWIESGEDEAERRKRRFLSGIPAAVMEQVLRELEAEHGSAHGYLVAAGARPEDLDRVRRRLLA